MNIKKNCPQCGAVFEGRSNQLYCGSICKQRAFYQGKAQEHKPVVSITGLDQTILPARLPSSRSASPVSRTDIELEKIRLQRDEVMRRLDHEERERERQHDLKKQERLHRQELEIIDQKRKMDEQQREADRQAALDQLKVSEPPMPVELIAAEPTDDSIEEESTIGGLGVGIAVGVIGIIMANLFFSKPTPGKPENPINKSPPKPTPKPVPGLDGLQLE